MKKKREDRKRGDSARIGGRRDAEKFPTIFGSATRRKGFSLVQRPSSRLKQLIAKKYGATLRIDHRDSERGKLNRQAAARRAAAVQKRSRRINRSAV